MSPDERQWSDGRLNDLAQKVDLMATAINHVARHAVKIDVLEEDVRENKATRKDDVARFETAMKEYVAACEQSNLRLEQKIDGHRWTPGVKVAAGAVVASSIGTIATILLQGSPS